MTDFDPPATLPAPPPVPRGVPSRDVPGSDGRQATLHGVTARHQEFMTLMAQAQHAFLDSRRALAAAPSPAPDAPPPLRELTFVVTTGRSGSTAVSNILNAHPDVVSLNEFFFSVRTLLPDTEVFPATAFWRALAMPHPMFDALLRAGITVPEFLYPKLKGTRFGTEKGGIPAVCMMSLPHLTANPDRVFDELAAEVPTWPDQTTAQHCLRLFAWLGRKFGGTVGVERSGLSLSWVPWLRRCFPYARFLHLHRGGPDSAVSMSRHPGPRLFLIVLDYLQRLDPDTWGSSAPGRTPALDLAAIPFDLFSLLDIRYDHLMDIDLPVARFAELWSDLVRMGVSALSDLPADRCRTLSFEDLIQDPILRLSDLAEFVGVTPSEQWLRESAATLDPSRVGTASSMLSARELDEVRERCAPGEAALTAAAR